MCPVFLRTCHQFFYFSYKSENAVRIFEFLFNQFSRLSEIEWHQLWGKTLGVHWLIWNSRICDFFRMYLIQYWMKEEAATSRTRCPLFLGWHPFSDSTSEIICQHQIRMKTQAISLSAIQHEAKHIINFDGVISEFAAVKTEKN